ncbi:MAG: hypothetical protein JSV98_02610 [candidate division WOR-3 bacterium]|nr:MAG: hypothetical protein JSV98_02610 [candidate division WOR-3 bacterium]
MRELIEIRKDEIIPDQTNALALQGICPGTRVSANILKLFDRGLEIFAKEARPVGMVAAISGNDFDFVYAGEGRNDTNTPVAEIFRKADHLALFAVTVGQTLHDKINELFVAKDFALGSMLDSVASVGVEKAADLLEIFFRDGLQREFGVDGNIAVMRYSPGYCGWHVSGQRKLFDYLKPEEVGITLRPSYLMEPLKSASGVIIAGSPEIHVFADTYACCSQCESHSCRQRISRLVNSTGASGSGGQPAAME